MQTDGKGNLLWRWGLWHWDWDWAAPSCGTAECQMLLTNNRLEEHSFCNMKHKNTNHVGFGWQMTSMQCVYDWTMSKWREKKNHLSFGPSKTHCNCIFTFIRDIYDTKGKKIDNKKTKRKFNHSKCKYRHTYLKDMPMHACMLKNTHTHSPWHPRNAEKEEWEVVVRKRESDKKIRGDMKDKKASGRWIGGSKCRMPYTH